MIRPSSASFSSLTAILFLIFAGCSDEVTSSENQEIALAGKTSKFEDQTIKLEDGATYKGSVLSGKPHGVGQMRFSNGDFYEGSFVRGRRYGQGIMTYRSDKNLKRYDGSWKNNKRHGNGIQEYADGTTEDGIWNNGQFIRGKRTEEELIFEGVWSENLFQGIVKFSQGKSFTGILENDELKKGFLVTAEGDRYVGPFLEGLYHGTGSLEKDDGELYVGNFHQGRYQGIGRLENAGGNVYVGEFSNGFPHGQGRQTDVSGVEYVGHWENGQRQGSGVLTFRDGARFAGEFDNGYAVDGQYFWPDGRVTRSYQDQNGQWNDKSP